MVKSMSGAPLEKAIEAAVIREFSEVIQLKTYTRNWPDRIFFLPRGKTVFMEFKRLGRRLRPAQALALEMLRVQGFAAYKVDSVSQALAILKEEMEK
jgi:hypothetical protein